MQIRVQVDNLSSDRTYAAETEVEGYRVEEYRELYEKQKAVTESLE